MLQISDHNFQNLNFETKNQETMKNKSKKGDIYSIKQHFKVQLKSISRTFLMKCFHSYFNNTPNLALKHLYMHSTHSAQVRKKSFITSI